MRTMLLLALWFFLILSGGCKKAQQDEDRPPEGPLEKVESKKVEKPGEDPGPETNGPGTATLDVR